MNRKIFPLILMMLSLVFSCTDDSKTEQESLPDFGTLGTHNVSKYSAQNDAFTTAYYPEDLSNMDKTPVLFFISGWFGSPQPSETYETLLQFIASHGYIVIYTDQGSTTNHTVCIAHLDTFLASADTTIQNVIVPKMDKDNYGVLGHSAGGGVAFTVMQHFNDLDYGASNRMLMVYDPWYAFGMSESMMQNLPGNTNTVIEKFGYRGNNPADGTDARIPLTEYYLLNSIPDKNKDYYVYDQENADHDYPKGNRSISQMQGILKPLDALLYYSFKEKKESVREIALENGNDDPYANGNGIQEVLDSYQYPCDGAQTLIDYCAIVP